MKLLAFSCYNIWPFLDTTVSLFLRDGKFMINAPIGSGKSFLFFDGPWFALYKNSSRPMLSIKAYEGWVKILFEHQWKIIICIRNITRTKSWNDTVKSLLYTIENITIDNIYTQLSWWDIVSYGKDIFETIKKLGNHEQIECKNETDVQMTLEPFLPPQEVFLNTTMLMQDSTNVFELTPGDRISLFKEIFWLISIDSATEKIADEKKGVSALLKAKQLTDDVDKNLQKYLGEFCDYTEDIFWSLDNNIISSSTKNTLEQYRKEIKLIVDHITITSFGRDENITKLLYESQKNIAQERDKQHALLWWLQSLEQNYANHLQRGKILTNNKQNIIRNIASQQSIIKQQEKLLQSDINNNNIDTWFKNDYQSRLNTLPAKWFDAIQDYTKIHNIKIKSSLHVTDKDFWLLRDYTQQFIQQWLLLTEKEKNLTTQIEQLISIQQDDQNTLTTYKKQRQDLEWDYKQKKKFFCEKISDTCPFIEQINSGVFSALRKNIELLDETIKNLKNTILQKNIEQLLIDKNNEIKKIHDELTYFKNHIWRIEYASIKEAKNYYDALLNMQKEEHLRTQKLQEVRTIYATALWELKILEQQLAIIETDISTWEHEKIELENTLMKSQKDSINQTITLYDSKLYKIVQSIQLIQHIEHLVQNHKETQRVIKWLRERENILNDLHRIFSKEIMIKVLEDALPFFAEYVNNSLAKMVSFSIHFTPRKTNSDKLELDITIRDNHGERTAKSLSGWQKAILRLAWILGVAKITNASQLFLDETINNIDKDTIWLVADMLKDYIKVNDISLYLVTHSSQLKEMDIWDSIINISHNA